MKPRDFDPANSYDPDAVLWGTDCPEDRDTWAHLLALYLDEGGSPDTAMQYCEAGPNFDRAAAQATIRSLSRRPASGRKGALLSFARQLGYRDMHSPSVTPSGRALWRVPVSDGQSVDQLTQDRMEPAGNAQEPRTNRRKGEDINPAPAALWSGFPPAPAEHGYLTRKGMAPDGLRIASAGLRIAGHDCAGWLAAPVWSIESGELQSIQFASPEAGPPKLSLPGCRIAGGALVVHQDAPEGRPTAEAFAAGVAYLAEGVATAASLYQATGRPAVACFGKGNLSTIAAALRAAFPALRVVLCPDRGGEHQAADIARTLGGAVAWVALPEHYPQNADANDYAAAEGFETLAELLKDERTPPQRFILESAAAVAERPSAPELVRGILPAAGIGALFGPSASGKTFLALHLLAHVAGGAPEWFGQRINRAAPVVYVGLEGEGGLSRRVKAWQVRYGALARFHFITRQPFALLSDQDVADLAVAVLATAGPGAVVCIDTLNAAAPGADENASDDMGRMVAAAKRLQVETAGLVLLVHHSGKDASKGMRGHSSLFAACDFVLEVTRTEDRREWRLAKSKDGADDIAHPFRLEVVEIGTDPEDGEPITSCIVAPDERAAEAVRRANLPAGGNQRIIFDALRDLLRNARAFGMAGAPPTRPCIELEEAIAKTRDRLACDSDRKTERTRAAFVGLVNRGAIVLREGWIWLA